MIRCGFGMPAFNNDEIVIPEFIKLGIEPQDAYDYAAIGCIETAVGGKWGYRCTGMSFINFARVMLATLEGGRDATSGRCSLPNNMRCRKAISLTSTECWKTGILRSATTPVNPSRLSTLSIPCWKRTSTIFFCSALVDDCIERAKSIKQGGAKYDWVSGLQVGIANLGNSPGGGEKKLVFDQGRHRPAGAGESAGGRFLPA